MTKQETKLTPENSREGKFVMEVADVILFYQELQSLGIPLWVDGGWGVDALLEQQTRTHTDLDVAIEKKHIKTVRELLESRGWKVVPRDDLAEHNFHLGDSKGREIDFHVIVLDEKGNGIYGPPENGEMYPASSLMGRGKIGDLEVKCISPEAMIKFHSGYELKEKDYNDVSALCRKFGIPLPDEYKSFEHT